MKLTFSDAVRDHRFSLKCMPHDTDMQRIENMSVSVYPDHITSEDTDSHGNITLFGYTNEYHRSFGFDVKGIALAGISDFENARDLHQVGMYRYQTKITAPGSAIREFYDSLKLSEYENTKEKALHIMESLNDSFQ